MFLSVILYLCLLQVVMVKIAHWHWSVYMHTRTHGSCDAGIHCILCINLYLYFLQVVVLNINCLSVLECVCTHVWMDRVIKVLIVLCKRLT